MIKVPGWWLSNYTPSGISRYRDLKLIMSSSSSNFGDSTIYWSKSSTNFNSGLFRSSLSNYTRFSTQITTRFI